MVFKEKECKLCKNMFLPTGCAAMYCSACKEKRKIEQKEYNKIRMQEYRIKHGLINKPGVGSGKNQPKGKDSPYYRNGVKQFQRDREKLRKERRYCERCHKDLKTVSVYYWCVHHKDHNRDNNTYENYELLCKRCHQLHHNCIENLPNGM